MRLIIIGFIQIFLFCACSSNLHEQHRKIDLADIKSYAWMAQLIYKDNKRIRARYTEYDKLLIYDVDGVEGKYMVLIDHDKQQQILVFRGTANWVNMIDDLRFTSRLDEELEIPLHSGFHNHALAVLRHIRENCLNELDDDYYTYVIGHSMGGAIAAIVSAYLMEEGFDISFVITFGQPKFTNRLGATELNKLPLLRVVNHGDIVADVPVFDRDLSRENQYVHLGLEMLLIDEKSLVLEFKESATGERPGFLSGFFSKINLNNHMMPEYLRKLDALLATTPLTVIEVDYEGWLCWRSSVIFSWEGT